MFVSRRIFSIGLLLAAAFLVESVSAAPTQPLVTILDGDAFLLRGSEKLALAEGVPLQPEDIVEVPASSRMARIEVPDGLALALGPGSRTMLAPRLGGERAGARIYLLSGWAKLDVPKGVQAAVLSRALDIRSGAATVVMSVQPAAATLFVEAGEATAGRNSSAMKPVKAGELLSMAAAEDAQPVLTNRPTQAYVATLPRAFMDNIPLRAAQFTARPSVPRSLGPVTYADAQPWIDAERVMRRAYLPRWRALARDPDARRELLADMKSHPEWAAVLARPADK